MKHRKKRASKFKADILDNPKKTVEVGLTVYCVSVNGTYARKNDEKRRYYE